ncbi:MAG: hypothetical protein GSR85_11000 [Desulfurococcales archaeon]|nr:hypothetical protein [Desulfurococcales archaeon]
MVSRDPLQLVSEYALRLKRLVVVVDGRPLFKNGAREVMEELRFDVAKLIVGEALDSAVDWITRFNESVDRLKAALRVRDVVLPKELRSFIRDPLGHLSKKLYQVTLDLARGRVEPAWYYSKARSILSTSISTNMRSIYQYWVLVSLLAEYGYKGGVLIYPEHGYLHIERSGKQRSGSIPANAVVRLPGAREASFYAEAPRPVGWGDSRGLERAWRLYTSLRPDFIVYSGRVLDMVEYRDEGVGIRRPNVIIECKELPDWYEKTRYLKGPINRDFTAEEWYSRWFEGLKEGLALILGEDVQSAKKSVEGVRVKEYKLVLLYREVYNPDTLILVSRSTLPATVKRELESEGVVVIDDAKIGDTKRIRELADEVEKYFQLVKEGPLDELEHQLWLRGVPIERSKLEEVLARIAIERMEEIIGRLKE